MDAPEAVHPAVRALDDPVARFVARLMFDVLGFLAARLLRFVERNVVETGAAAREAAARFIELRNHVALLGQRRLRRMGAHHAPALPLQAAERIEQRVRARQRARAVVRLAAGVGVSRTGSRSVAISIRGMLGWRFWTA